MTEIFELGEAVVPDGDFDDIVRELHQAGRELTFGFSGMWHLDLRKEDGGPSDGTAKDERCPSCASPRLLVAAGPRSRRNFFCLECALCWHDFADCRVSLRRQ